MSPKKSRHALLVLWLGFAALVLHALAGIAHARAPAIDGVLEICTAQGVVRVDAETLQPLAEPATAEPAHAAPHCCDLCGASCAAAVAASASPAHPLGIRPAAAPVPVAEPPAAPAAEALTPLVPRGPPAHS